MARKQNTPTTSNEAANLPRDEAREGDEAGEGEGEAPAAQGSQWAREKARAIAQGGAGKAAHRFAKLADVLQTAALSGEHKLSFTQANERANLRRGETGNPAASWRLALQRTRQVFGSEPTVSAWRVDADTSALVYTGNDEAGE